MNTQKIARINGGQDGAIFGSELFRLDTDGTGFVYDLSALPLTDIANLPPKASFSLDRGAGITPHSNAVCFGSEFYAPDDPYPLLYSNVYNNYAAAEDPLHGVCCVYRLQRCGGEITATLVQLIAVGFTEDPSLWKASEEHHGPRPYGNFLIDREANAYYAFVMRDDPLGTRYFRFDVPSVHDGELDPVYNVRKVVLKETDIRETFDMPQHRYIQGAACHEGKIYSTEGFDHDTVNVPAIRIIDLAAKTERYIPLPPLGIHEEPEMIDFHNGVCLYSDVAGNLYSADFS